MKNIQNAFKVKCDTCGQLTQHVATPGGDGYAEIECAVCHFKYPVKWNAKTRKTIETALGFPEKNEALTQTLKGLRRQIDVKLLKRDSPDE